MKGKSTKLLAKNTNNGDLLFLRNTNRGGKIEAHGKTFTEDKSHIFALMDAFFAKHKLKI